MNFCSYVAFVRVCYTYFRYEIKMRTFNVEKWKLK